MKGKRDERARARERERDEREGEGEREAHSLWPRLNVLENCCLGTYVGPGLVETVTCELREKDVLRIKRFKKSSGVTREKARM